jgi:hypothetical protein
MSLVDGQQVINQQLISAYELGQRHGLGQSKLHVNQGRVTEFFQPSSVQVVH